MRWKIVAAAFSAGVLISILLVETFAGSKDSLGLVPLPRHVEQLRGTFVLRPETRILVDANSRRTGELLGERLRPATGYLLPISGEAQGVDGTITLTTSNAPRALGPEGYQLEVAHDGVVIRAAANAGLFYGAQTLLELLPREIFSSKPVNAIPWKAQCVSIEDAPRFPWRGLMLDVSRHFFNKPELKVLLDAMALHKLNVFHWHLTDDQGWRLEIKKYPRLTEVGAWRRRIGFNLDPKSSTAYGPDKRYGGFYTQEDIREIVAYAGQRHIAIVPEIEMPGHATAALAAYPELGCFPEKSGYSTDAGAGVLAGVLCAGKDDTFEFATNVLSEVLELFPGHYIHVGGDEVPTENWRDCPSCQARMQREGLKTERELEGYFMRRIDGFLQAHGRKLIGWTEIAEGGLPPNAAMLDWLGGATDAADSGHDVVMAPNAYCYFDSYQTRDRTGEPAASGAYLPLHKVYSFEPIPTNLDLRCQGHILGAQGNVWTEYMPSLSQVEYMTFPRLCALAEVVWSPAASRNWEDFTQRLPIHLRRLDELGIHYRAAASQFAHN